jgi:hypothetical protein
VPKTLTREQVAGRKDKAERFVRDVLGDDDRADEIADESVEDYADRRKIQIADNPHGGTMTVRTSNPRGKKSVVQMKTDNGTSRIANAGEIQVAAEHLNELNDLQRENEVLQDRLDKIADLASAPNDEESETDEERKAKLNEILDVAAPGEEDESEDDEDEEEEEDE